MLLGSVTDATDEPEVWIGVVRGCFSRGMRTSSTKCLFNSIMAGKIEVERSRICWPSQFEGPSVRHGGTHA